MTRIAILLLVVVASFGSAFAQTKPKPDGQWRGALGLGLTAASGNTESTTFAVNADAVRQTGNDKLSGYFQSVYGREKSNGISKTTSELIRAGGEYNRDVNERTFGFGSLYLERDGLIDLDLRSVAAGGLGYHVIRRDDLSFDVSTGPAYNREQYATLTRDWVEWLLAEETHHELAPGVTWRQRLATFANLDDFGEFRAVFDAGLVLKLARGWSVTITLNDRYQSNPLPGVKKNDLLFVTGLQYGFGPK